MKGLESLLQEVVVQGDLRKKEAKKLEQAVKDACDQIGAAALKAGVWGKYISVNLGSVDDDGYTDKDFIAFLTWREINGEDQVVVRLAETWEQEQHGGWSEMEIEPCNEYWTNHKVLWCPPRRLTVKLASRLEELAQTLHDRCKQLADETQQARKAADSFKL